MHLFSVVIKPIQSIIIHFEADIRMILLCILYNTGFVNEQIHKCKKETYFLPSLPLEYTFSETCWRIRKSSIAELE